MIANNVSVAQAISRALDDVQEFGTSDGAMGLFLSREDNQVPETDLRITEVGAKLLTTLMASGDVSEFYVTTSDGKTFAVSVKEVAR